ncbi:hypothetical protein GCM10027074_01440 [Streptomyces deserti]
MSGVGPVEPGEGTHAWDTQKAHTPQISEPPHNRLIRLYAEHRRAVLGTATAAAVLAGGGYLYATRPQEPPAPPPPYPSQVVTISYLSARSTPRDAPARSFSFDAAVTVASGPPITVTRIDQPYAGLRVTSRPPAPFRTTTGNPRKITITVQVTECGKVPGDAGLPFLDVTLRNARAIQVHSFILGPRYAQHLSKALQVACSNDSASLPKPRTHLNAPPRVLRVLTMWTGRIGKNSAVPPTQYRSAIRRVITRASQPWSDSPPRSPHTLRVTASHRAVR